MLEDTGAPPRGVRRRPRSPPPGGDAREVHLDDGLLDRGLAPVVALDDGRPEGRAAEFRHAEIDLPGPGDELSGVVAATPGLPACRPLAALDLDEPGHLLVELRF